MLGTGGFGWILQHDLDMPKMAFQDHAGYNGWEGGLGGDVGCSMVGSDGGRGAKMSL